MNTDTMDKTNTMYGIATGAVNAMDDINTTDDIDVTGAQTQSSLMELFGPDLDGELQKARDKIYSSLWSRYRRDDAKLDWVLSQNGLNRNVPERYIESTPHGSTAFQSTHEVPCWLQHANETISADFTRYIYTMNELEVDVDLKATHTAENEAKLHKIISLLQDPNFARYTRSVRVRIHFPDTYPFQELPTFNQIALEDIATILDGFEQLECLDIRIVTMQGPMDYELHAAAFPFYPMEFTDWSIHVFNNATSEWDVVDLEQQHRLNLAWDNYQDTGSLTMNNQVAENVAENEAVPDMDNTMCTYASDTSGSAIMTPIHSSSASSKEHKATYTTQPQTKVDGMIESMSRASQPPSPAPSSVTLGWGQETAESLSEAAQSSNGGEPFNEDQDGKQPLQMKRRNRKTKKPKAIDDTFTSDISRRMVERYSDSDEEDSIVEDETPVDTAIQPRVSNENQADVNTEDQTFVSNEEQTQVKDYIEVRGSNGSLRIYTNTKPSITLSELTNLRSFGDQLCSATMVDGNRAVFYKTREAQWHLRQNERLAAIQREKEVERVERQEKRQSKMVKQTLIRRKDPSQKLRRQVEDTKKQSAEKQSVKKHSGDLKDIMNQLDNGGNAEVDFLAFCLKVGITLFFPGPGTDNKHTAGPGELRNNNDNNDDDVNDSLYQQPASHTHLYPEPQYGHPYASQSSANLRASAQNNENYKWASTVSKNDVYHFRGQGTQAAMEREMETLNFGNADMAGQMENHDHCTSAYADGHYQDFPREKVLSMNASPTQSASTVSTELHYHGDCQVENQQLVKEPDGTEVPAAQYADDESLPVVQDYDEVNADKSSGNTALVADHKGNEAVSTSHDGKNVLLVESDSGKVNADAHDRSKAVLAKHSSSEANLAKNDGNAAQLAENADNETDPFG